MVKASEYLIFLFLVWSISASAISHLTLNGSKETIVSETGQKFLLAGNVESPGNRLSCYFYVDVNNNRKIDAKDALVDFCVLKDGIGWIKDSNCISGDIRGDESYEPREIKTTFSAQKIFPPNSQNWIVKAVDEDSSEACAFIRWDINSQLSSVNGRVIGPNSVNQDYVIYAIKEDYFLDQKIALVNDKNEFSLILGPGYWHLVAQSIQDSLLQFGFCEIQINGNDKHNVNLLIEEDEFPDIEYLESDNYIESEKSDKDFSLVASAAFPEQLSFQQKKSHQETKEKKQVLIQTNSQTQKRATTISGAVFINSETPASNIDIVAINEHGKSPEGFLYTKTNSEGIFSLATDIEGDWKIGVYSTLFEATPAVQFLYLSNGENYSGLKYNLALNTENLLLGAKGNRLYLSLAYSSPRMYQPVFQVKFPQGALAKGDILNMEGENIRTLLNTKSFDGAQKIRWDGRDEEGRESSSGVYVCRVQAMGETVVRTFALLK